VGYVFAGFAGGERETHDVAQKIAEDAAGIAADDLGEHARSASTPSDRAHTRILPPAGRLFLTADQRAGGTVRPPPPVVGPAPIVSDACEIDDNDPGAGRDRRRA